jgi:hypothetical protein
VSWVASIKPYAKAVTGAVVAGLTTAAVALQPTQAEAVSGLTTSPITGAEAVGIAIAFFSALALVWAVPNTDEKAEHQSESVQPPEDETLRAQVERDRLVAAGVPESALTPAPAADEPLTPGWGGGVPFAGGLPPELETADGAPLPGDER